MKHAGIYAKVKLNRGALTFIKGHSINCLSLLELVWLDTECLTHMSMKTLAMLRISAHRLQQCMSIKQKALIAILTSLCS